jgi:hypothetical protein
MDGPSTGRMAQPGSRSNFDLIDFIDLDECDRNRTQK